MRAPILQEYLDRLARARTSTRSSRLLARAVDFGGREEATGDVVSSGVCG
jgi:hypothetical protein